MQGNLTHAQTVCARLSFLLPYTRAWERLVLPTGSVFQKQRVATRVRQGLIPVCFRNTAREAIGPGTPISNLVESKGTHACSHIKGTSLLISVATIGGCKQANEFQQCHHGHGISRS